MPPTSRRNFIKTGSLGLAAVPLGGLAGSWTDPVKAGETLPEVHIFSKHLQFLDLKSAAREASSLGFQGLDLTVRPGGHVEPVQAEEKLPQAIEAIRSGGSSCRFITTAVSDAGKPTDKKLLEVASGLGITHYRPDWYRYDPALSMEASLQNCRTQLESLSALNKELGLVGCYQNHAGSFIGASLWEVQHLLETSEPRYFGIQYDIRHATVEGGLSWENGLRLVQNRIKNIVLKDFKWVKKSGTWTIENTPLGEGMVDFKRYFHLLKTLEVQVPAILHLEYPLGGAEHGHKQLSVPHQTVFTAMKKDLNKFRELWELS